MNLRWSIRKKLTLVVAMMVVMTAAMVTVIIVYAREISVSTASLVREFDHLNAVQELRVSVIKLLMPGNDYLIHGHTGEMQQFRKFFKTADEKLDVAYKMVGEEEDPLVRDLMLRDLNLAYETIGEVNRFSEKIFALKDPVGNPEGAVFMERMDTLVDGFTDGMDFLIEELSRHVYGVSRKIAGDRRRIQTMTTLMGLETIFFVMGGGFAFVFMITHRLRRLVDATSRVSSGDLTARIDVGTRDELGELAGAFNAMTADLRRLIENEKELAATQAAFEVEHVKAEELRRAYDDLKSVQAQLLQAEKLSGIGLLAAGVAHELNSPLAGLLSLMRTYRKSAVEGTPEAEDLTDMMEATEHMAKIVRDLNAFSRKEAGDVDEVNLADVVDSTLSFSGYFLREKNVEIVKDYAPDLLRIRGNKAQLQEVVLNMITNARDAMPEGGRFTIRVKNSDDRRCVVVEFFDTGIGIKKENISKIFNPFFTTKEPGKGTGLGLSVSFGIIKNHGGDVRVESEEGKGARFEMTFPAVMKD